MKKLKIVCLSLMSIFLLFFSVFSFSVEVKAAIKDTWQAPESAKNFYDIDGKGIRLYIYSLYGDDVSGELSYAVMIPIRDYYFDDGELEAAYVYQFGKHFFSSNLLNNYISGALQYYGSGFAIPESDRVYVCFYPWVQRFYLEFHGPTIEYAVYLLEYGYDNGYDTGFDLGREIGLDEGYDYGYDYGYNYGYDVGYDEGYIEGVDLGYHDGYYEGSLEGLYISECGPIYEQGFKDGQESKLAANNAAFYQGIEKWLVPAIMTVIALGGFVTIAARKRRDE